MVAYAYAQAYRDEVTHLAVADAPLPGTTVFDRMRIDPRVWQFSFRRRQGRARAGHGAFHRRGKSPRHVGGIARLSVGRDFLE
jgi:hypothetical protein